LKPHHIKRGVELEFSKMSKVWAMTHVGHVRTNNEDWVEVSSRRSEARRDRFGGYIDNEHGWALVADGMGGHAAGEIASELAVELLRPVMTRLQDETDVRLALDATNEGLFEAMGRNTALHGMGTTIAGVVFRGTEVLAFNLGDSRIYTFSDEKLTRVSCDHVVEDHILTQCLGGSGESPLSPHVTRFELKPYSKIMICSDGLTDMVTDDKIAQLLAGRSAHPAYKLGRAALKAGGVDNVSVVVFEVYL